MTIPLETCLRRASVGLTVLLALLLAWSVLRLLLLEPPEPIPPADATLRVEAILGEELAASEEVPDLVSRPLFWPGREPFVPASGPVEEPQEQPAKAASIRDLKLLGVYSAGGNSGIIVQHKGERRRMGLDESVDGWQLVMMSDDGAVFQSGGEVRTLQLEHALPAPGGGDRGRPASRSRRLQDPTVNQQEGD